MSGTTRCAAQPAPVRVGAKTSWPAWLQQPGNALVAPAPVPSPVD